MQGLSEAKDFYEEYGAEMLQNKFPEYEGRIAVGLAGHGSECFGFDDELSRDHDFHRGFCLWIDRETDLSIGVALRREYRALPIERPAQRSALGESCRGVMEISDFYRRYTGSAGAPESWQQWMSLPSYALAEAVNGEVWRDDSGVFSAIRKDISEGMPEDVRLKKLAARTALMAQAGQYNFSRCVKHGEKGAAMLAVSEFVNAACGEIYLLNRRHMPYYKWQLRGMERLERLAQMKEALEYLLLGGNDEEGLRLKSLLIEDICASVVAELQRQKLTDGSWDYLEPHAMEIMERIEKTEIGSLHLMEG